ncbi:hypothetical protein COL60_24000 [Bacillus pseudomycoides]|uniref:hypothetical protein n=1 Tax=Bacillus pseudomycoides TaxID=64104 RepID=UPI000BECEECA|nr:hypothetical protein [Bacillus pseudomycoides]PEA80550.1 hypothetical protein CON99_27685 [Bacillus pseudomycoides]PFZ04782.1 hypothetical protein COL60_24000 [Bacillus pseudomycoides]PFZ10411.1 hypothetical protein COL63_19775 [Bacillus pseudomycoides]
MITLHNYPKLESYILIDNNTYSIKETGDRYKTVQGIGGISEDGQVVGIYVQDNKLFFFYNGQSFETSVDDLICTNSYISKLERCFSVQIGGQNICNIVYKPFIDPGMIYYDADPEEFDVLLYLSGIMKNEDSIKKFMKGMEIIGSQNKS